MLSLRQLLHSPNPPQVRHIAMQVVFTRLPSPNPLSADLEFSREDNPEVDGAAAVDALLSLLRDALRDRFGLDMQASAR